MDLTTNDAIWRPSHRFDVPARLLADRHYNRQKPGSPQFMPPGRTFVLKAANHKAVFGLSFPFPEYVKHAWAGAWINCIFRNEDAGPLASDMILEALGWAQRKWPVPAQGCVSFVDPRKVPGIPVRGERVKGFCYMMAGFKVVGETKGGLIAWQLLPHEMPPPMKFQHHSAGEQAPRVPELAESAPTRAHQRELVARQKE